MAPALPNKRRLLLRNTACVLGSLTIVSFVPVPVMNTYILYSLYLLSVILPPPPSTPPRDRWGGGWDEVLPQQFSRKLGLNLANISFSFCFHTKLARILIKYQVSRVANFLENLAGNPRWMGAYAQRHTGPIVGSTHVTQ